MNCAPLRSLVMSRRPGRFLRVSYCSDAQQSVRRCPKKLGRGVCGGARKNRYNLSEICVRVSERCLNDVRGRCRIRGYAMNLRGMMWGRNCWAWTRWYRTIVRQCRWSTGLCNPGPELSDLIREAARYIYYA